MRRRMTRAPKRKSSWTFGWFGTDGGPTQFLHNTLLSHWVIWPVQTLDNTRQTYDADVIWYPNDLTLVRSINNIATWVQDPNSGSGDGDFMFVLAFGLIKFSYADPTLVDLVENDAGVAIPGPWTNPSEDWVWRRVLSQRSFGSVSQEHGAGNTDFEGNQSRAMRKLSNNEGLLQVIEFNLLGADFGQSRDVSFYFESRCLYKEA